MAFTLSRAQLDQITDVELSFGTAKYLPTWQEIPAEFKDGKNIYVQLVTAIHNGWELPAATQVMRPGYDDIAAIKALDRCMRAHLRSGGPKLEHRIAGVALMLSTACEVIAGRHHTPKNAQEHAQAH